MLCSKERMRQSKVTVEISRNIEIVNEVKYLGGDKNDKI